jgi:hypothetical protein
LDKVAVYEEWVKQKALKAGMSVEWLCCR